MDYLFKLSDSYSESVDIGCNHLIFIIGSHIMEVVWVIIIYLFAKIQLYGVHVCLNNTDS